MALTRGMLKAMSIDEERIDQIIDAHTTVVDSIKAERDELKDMVAELKSEAEKVPDLQRQLEEAKAAIPTEDWHEKYEGAVKELEDFKAQVERDKAEADKAAAYRSLLREAGVDEKRIEAVMKVTDLSGITMSDGEIADREQVAEAIASEWKDFIPQPFVKGAAVDDPPASVPGKMDKEQILAIKDTQARQQAIADNIEQFQ